MKVLKFGGTSVGSPEMIRRVFGIVRSATSEEPVVVVVSAFGGVTNILEDLAAGASGGAGVKEDISTLRKRHLDAIESLITDEEIRKEAIQTVVGFCNDLESICEGVRLVSELTPRTRARILSAGELMSYTIISDYFKAEGLSCLGVDSRNLIVTKGELLAGDVMKPETFERLGSLQGQADVVVIPGFIARDHDGDTSTLGRGGSDYTAALVAAALSASVLEIWTDVSGVMTADPKLVRKAHPIAHLSYAEAMELSFFGAKVIYPPTIQPLVKAGIPIRIKNTMRPDDDGTLISTPAQDPETTVKGISSIPDVGLITVTGSGMIGVPGTAMRMFQAMWRNKLNVLFITQSSSEHTITAGLLEGDAAKAAGALREEFVYELERGHIDEILLETGLSLMAAVGDGMQRRPGIAARLFGLLGDNGINIRAIAQGSTERNVTFVVNTSDSAKALNVIHEGFFLSRNKVAHLFNIGVGNVGKALIGQLASQISILKEEQFLELRLSGLANSKKMVFEQSGLDASSGKTLIEDGTDFDEEKFVDRIIEMNARNSVFIDNTGSAEIAKVYPRLLANSIHVVTSNKIAASSPYEHYEAIQALAAESGVQFRYETNVAAGLPVINTMRDMLMTGDRIRRIEAVLSGSLNYIFNHIGENTPFSQAVRQAREAGLTEPDPAIDLSGLDVRRKILILARESGLRMEMEDVRQGLIIPEGLQLGTPWEELFEMIKEKDAQIEEGRRKVIAEGKAWRFMATLQNGEAEVGVQVIGPDHPAWVLEGMDNLVLIYSDRYPEQPLVIKGAGAGPEVTASGVLSDVLRIVNG